MGRFGRSWELIRLCWGVLQQDKELVVFPIVSGIAVVIVTASFIVPGIFTGYWESFVGDNGNVPVSMWVLVVLFYLVEYLVIIFFNAALVSAAMVRLKGGDPTLGDGLRGAWSHIGAILGWAAISATVGLVLQALRERGGIGGAIVAGLGGMAWNIITFLVIPVLVVEDVNPIEGIKRSASLLKKTWGEQIIGNAGFGLIFGLIGVAIAVVGIFLGVGGHQRRRDLGRRGDHRRDGAGRRRRGNAQRNAARHLLGGSLPVRGGRRHRCVQPGRARRRVPAEVDALAVRPVSAGGPRTSRPAVAAAGTGDIRASVG